MALTDSVYTTLPEILGKYHSKGDIVILGNYEQYSKQLKELENDGYVMVGFPTCVDWGRLWIATYAKK